MIKEVKRRLAIVLSVVMLITLSLSNISTAETAAGSKHYYIINPYATVDWATFGQYKADFHSHSIESDGSNTPAAMFEDHYAKGFDIQALTDHNFTNTTWDRTDRPANITYLTSNRLAEINAGIGRDGRGMIGIPYSNEQSISDHVNTFWADFNNTSGATLESNIAKCEALGGISHINHAGRYTGGANQTGTAGEAASNNPTTVAKYVNLFKKYPSCVGMEIINKKDGDSASDRILWDNILKQTMPNRPVWGFSNDDSHSLSATGFSYNMMLMPENNLQNMRYSMENGTFYAVALVSKRELGTNFVASGPAPKITNITVDQNENSITITGQNYTTIEWIADGKIIATGETIDLNDYEDKVDNYIRAQLKGAGGISFTQPFGINDAPILASIGDKSVDEGQTIAFTVEASDPEGDALTYSTGALPRGASFDANTREFTWTTDYTQAGTYQIRFEVSDGVLTASEEITITVNDVLAEEQIINLKGSIESLDLNKGLKNSLTVKLDNTLKSLEKDKNNSVNILNAFINEVKSLSEGKLTGEQAAELIKEAEEIILNITSSR